MLVSGHRDFDYAELAAAKRALDAGAALFATSRDPTLPMPGGELPGTGAVLAAVETASGRRAEIGGKPERHLFELALAAIPGAERVAMVGDRLSSDIAGGHAAGLATVLVLSGTSGDSLAARRTWRRRIPSPTSSSRTWPPCSRESSFTANVGGEGAGIVRAGEPSTVPDPSSERSDPSSPRSRRAFAGVFSLTFCGLVAVGAVLPVLPGYVKNELGYGDVAVGVVIGCYAVSGLLLRPIAGRLADTRGRKWTALGGALLLSAGGFLYLAPLGLGGLIVARLILGIGEGALYTAGSAWIVDLSPPERRGRILGLYGLAVWGGLAVGPLLGTRDPQRRRLRGGLAAGSTAAAGGALAGLAVGDPFKPLAHAEPHPLVAPEAVRPGIAVGLAAIGYATVAAFVVLLLEKRGIDQGAAVFAAFAGAIVLGRLALGDLPDRIGPAPVAIGATVAEAVGLLAIAVAGSLPVALLGGIAMGTGFALLNPALMLIVVDQVSATARGAALGTFTAFFDAGVGVGAPLAGLAAALTNYEGAFLLAAALSLASAATIYLTVHGHARLTQAKPKGGGSTAEPPRALVGRGRG